MEAKELQIMDLVRQKFSGLLLRVHSVMPPYILAYGEEGQFHEDSIEPIPITIGILEQNGFQKGGSHYILYDDKEDDDSEPVGGYEIRFYPGNNFCSIQNLETEADISFYCEYIHQLQQAMRLCGIDKEIKL